MRGRWLMPRYIVAFFIGAIIATISIAGSDDGRESGFSGVSSESVNYDAEPSYVCSVDNRISRLPIYYIRFRHCDVSGGTCRYVYFGFCSEYPRFIRKGRVNSEGLIYAAATTQDKSLSWRASTVYPCRGDYKAFCVSGYIESIWYQNIAFEANVSALRRNVIGMRVASLFDRGYDDSYGKKCIYTDPDSCPQTYMEVCFITGVALLVIGITIFGKGYMGAGKSRYAGFLVCIGWVIQLGGVGLICVGIWLIA